MYALAESISVGKLGAWKRNTMTSSEEASQVGDSKQAGYSIPEEVVFRELDGEAVLLHLAKGEYFGLDSVGTRMWNLLRTEERAESVIDRLEEEYAAGRDRLTEDVGEFIERLAERGLLVLKGTKVQ